MLKIYSAVIFQVSSDKEIMLAAVRQDGHMLMFAAEPLRHENKSLRIGLLALLKAALKLKRHASMRLISNRCWVNTL